MCAFVSHRRSRSSRGTRATTSASASPVCAVKERDRERMRKKGREGEREDEKRRQRESPGFMLGVSVCMYVCACSIGEYGKHGNNHTSANPCPPTYTYCYLGEQGTHSNHEKDVEDGTAHDGAEALCVRVCV